MELLVMGGTEFVSRSVAEYFISKDYEVSILTRGKKNIEITGIKRHIIADRRNMDDLKQLEDYVFDYVIDINAYTEEDVKTLIDHIDKRQLKRYVLCSTGGVYLTSESVLSEDDEKGHNASLGTYGFNKYKAESYVLDLFDKSGFPVCIFRPTYIYGQYNGIYREGYFFDTIENDEILPIPFSDNKMQFIHIDDLVTFIHSTLHNDRVLGEAYNITHDECVTFQDIVRTVEAVMDKKSQSHVVKNKDFDALSYFPYYDMPYMLSIEKLKNHGLHTPKYNLYEGLKLTYEWYKKERPKALKHRMGQLEEVRNYVKSEL